MNKPNTEPEDWKKIVIQLEEAFEKSGMTQEELALKCGMLQSSISRIFSLLYVPKLSTVTIIAAALNLKLDIKADSFNEPDKSSNKS